MNEIPDKLFYKIGEVCQYTDTQPYVLRFLIFRTSSMSSRL